MDLAEILTQAIADRCAALNATGRRWPDRPIVVELSWHPGMGKCDMKVSTIDHLPPWRIKPQDPSLGGTAA